MNIEIEKLTTWSAGREVRTQNGPRILRKGPLTAEYRAAWRANKDEMKKVGLSMGPVDRNNTQGDWEAIWWQPINGEVAKERDAAVEASRATDAAVDIPVPSGLAYMPFQKAGIAFAMGKPGVLLADEMGLGKTIQAIGIINADPSIKRVLVVCPASLKTNWRNELNKWLVRPARVAIQNAGQPWAGSVADIIVINYNILGKFTRQLMSETWDLLVADECQYAKNPQAQRTKLLVGAQSKADREEYPGIRAVRKVAATGTPILNKPVELFPILDYIAPGQWGFKDKIRYCAGYKGRWGWDFTGHAHEEEFQRRLRETIMVRRLKRDVLTELPAKRRQIIELDAGDAASLCAEEVGLYDGNSEEIEAAGADKALAEAADDEEAYKNAVARLRSAQKVAFERVSKVRHEVALAKVEQAVDHIMDVLESTPKLVVFAHHLDVIARIERELTERLQAEGSASNPVCVVTGQTPVGERQGIVDLFNNDSGKRALILGIHAAGVGLSVKASVEVFVELDWVPGIISQAEDRCHGIGRGIEGEPLLVQHLVLEGSLDSRMAKIVVAKQDVADRMLDKELAKMATGEPVTALDIEFDADKVRREDAKAADPELHDAVLLGLQMLAGVCDGAAMRDDMGFNGCDARIGHSLARLSRLSPKQVALGRRVLLKYHRQLPDDVNAKIRDNE